MSLDGRYDTGNIFAKIIRGEMPSVKVFEDDKVLAFMDVFPQSRGHALVISKVSQARNILEVEPDVLADLTAATQTLAKAVVTAAEALTAWSSPSSTARRRARRCFTCISTSSPVTTARPWDGTARGGMADVAELKALADKISAGALVENKRPGSLRAFRLRACRQPIRPGPVRPHRSCRPWARSRSRSRSRSCCP